MGSVISSLKNSNKRVLADLHPENSKKPGSSHVFPSDIMRHILSCYESPKDALHATHISQGWRNAVDLDMIKKWTSPDFLKSPTGLILQQSLTPAQILSYSLQQHHNFIHGRYEKGFLEKPDDSGNFIAMDFLKDERLVRVFENCLCVTDLRPKAIAMQTMTKKLSEPVNDCAIAKEGNKILLLLSTGLVKVASFEDNSINIRVAADLPNHSKSIALSTRGDCVVTQDDQGTIAFWDFRQNQVNRVNLAEQAEKTKFYFSPNHKHLAAVQNEVLFIWDYSQRLPQAVDLSHFDQDAEIIELYFSPSGHEIIVKNYQGESFFVDLHSNIAEIKRIPVNADNKFHFFPSEDHLIHNFKKNVVDLVDLNLNQHRFHAFKKLHGSTTRFMRNYHLTTNRLPNLTCLSPDGKRFAVVNYVIKPGMASKKQMYLDVLNLFVQEKTKQNFVEISIPFPSEFCDYKNVIFSPQSNQIIFNTYNVKKDQDQQLLINFSPKIKKNTKK